ncbi:MAG: outer membrane protein assembly factor BamD [Simkaniaceae bacterium]
MRKKYFLLFIFILSSQFLKAESENESIDKHLSVSEYYGRAMEALRESDWRELIHHCRQVRIYYPTSHFAEELSYYLGVGYYNKGDFETADSYFSQYLRAQASPKFFEEAISYKFNIAKQFENGAKKHLFGARNMPQWLPAKDEAIRIYDEVITSLPHHEVAAEALFRKAELYAQLSDYKGSVEAYQTLIRRFPKHPLSSESYLGILGVYLKQCQSKFPDPDYLDLAEINLRKFRRDFPGEPRINQAESTLLAMKEEFADELFQIGRFYEKTKKPDSAAIYYSTIVIRYPETRQAFLSKNRLEVMGREIPEPGMMAVPSDK